MAANFRWYRREDVGGCCQDRRMIPETFLSRIPDIAPSVLFNLFPRLSLGLAFFFFLLSLLQSTFIHFLVLLWLASCVLPLYVYKASLCFSSLHLVPSFIHEHPSTPSLSSFLRFFFLSFYCGWSAGRLNRHVKPSERCLSDIF